MEIGNLSFFSFQAQLLRQNQATRSVDHFCGTGRLWVPCDDALDVTYYEKISTDEAANIVTAFFGTAGIILSCEDSLARLTQNATSEMRDRVSQILRQT
jgi:hypothetical protein